MQKYYIGLGVIAAVCVGAILWYYVLSRGTASDQQKVSDVVALQTAINEYSLQNDTLPENLDQLEVDKKIKDRLKNYDYSRSEENYTICVNFKTDASADDYYNSDSDPYFHGKGRQCFTEDVYLYNSSPDPYTSPDYNYDDFDSLYNQSPQFDSLYQ